MTDDSFAKSDLWMIASSVIAVVSSAWWWLLNKIWKNQEEIGKVRKEVEDDLDKRADRLGRVLEQFRTDQKLDMKNAIDPLRSDLAALSRRIDDVMARRR